jgi:hypothetical protein
VAPVCTNCGSTDFVWAGELKTGGRLSAGQLSLRHGGELPLGTRICRTCGHADLFLRDTRILQAPHEWKPGEFVPIRTQASAPPSAPAPPPAPTPPVSTPAPAPSMAAPPPSSSPAPPTPTAPALSDSPPAAMTPPAEPASDASSSLSTPTESAPPSEAGAEAAKPKGAARRRSSKAKKASDEPEG